MAEDPRSNNEVLPEKVELLRRQLDTATQNEKSFLYVTNCEGDEIRKISVLKVLFSECGLDDNERDLLLNVYLRFQKEGGRSLIDLFKLQLDANDVEAITLTSQLLNAEDRNRAFTLPVETIDEIKRLALGKPEEESTALKVPSLDIVEKESPAALFEKAISDGYTAVLYSDSDDPNKISARPILQAVLSNNELGLNEIDRLVASFFQERRQKDGGYSSILMNQIGINYDQIADIAGQLGRPIISEHVADSVYEIPRGFIEAIVVYLQGQLDIQEEESVGDEDSSGGEDTEVIKHIKLELEGVEEFKQATESSENKPRNLYEFVNRCIDRGKFNFGREVQEFLENPLHEPDRLKPLLALIISTEMLYDKRYSLMTLSGIERLAEQCIEGMKKEGFQLEQIKKQLQMIVRLLDQKCSAAHDDFKKDLLSLIIIADRLKRRIEEKQNPKETAAEIVTYGSIRRKIAAISASVAILAAAAVAVVFSLKDGIVKPTDSKNEKSPSLSESAPEPPKPDSSFISEEKPAADVLSSKDIEKEPHPKVTVILSENVIDGSLMVNESQTSGALDEQGWELVKVEGCVVYIKNALNGKTAASKFAEADKVGPVEVEFEWTEI